MDETSVNAGGAVPARPARMDFERALVLDAAGVDLGRVYRTEELAPGRHIVFSATGITDGDFLRGVKFVKDGARTHGISMGHRSRVIRFSDAVHLWGDDARVTIQV
ncbi:MAG: fructose-bisphosphatase class II [Trueperaceae bacterium]|nr:fructose-bisphosphatase class II [Trueperaceae bacterium]